MENLRGLKMLKKCVKTSTSLQNFVEGVQKNVKESEKLSETNSKLKEVCLVGEIIDISHLEMCIVDPAIIENVYDTGVEDEIEEIGNVAEMMAEINAQVEAEINPEIEAESNDGAEIEVEITSAIEADIGDIRNIEDTEGNEKVLTRKRARNTDNWPRKINKLKRNLGECYKSEVTGRFFSARSVKPGWNSNCSHKCTINFTDSQREDLFKKYRAKKNLAFHFLKEDVLTRVCKTFFCNTLDISAKVIETSRSKFVNNVTQPDLRGKHGNQPSLSIELTEGIRRHIDSFERIESHYLRQQTKREYIDGSLTISSMYRMYKDKCISEGVGYAKQHAYEKIFNYNFNIGFFQPKKDQCIQCFQFDNSTEEQRAALQEVHAKHVSEKELSRLQKEEDKRNAEINKNTKVVCMDLQAVIPVPCGDVSSFFYKRRLLCFNFTIFELVSNEGFCFLWHEGIAHRGSDEIGASLMIYLSKCTDTEHLVIWSDNCFGQNKSKYMLSLLMQLVQVYNVKSITQKFLIVGHTQNEGDNMHSLIEKSKARCLKSGPIYTCDQLVPIIQLAKKSKPLYKVHQLQTNEVYDLKDLCSKTGKNFQKKNDKGEKVLWTEIKVLMVEKECLNIVKYKTSFADASYKSFKVSNEPKVIEMKPAYPNGPPKIPTAKKKDFMELCNQNSITACHYQFFNNLESEETEVNKPATTKRRRAGA